MSTNKMTNSDIIKKIYIKLLPVQVMVAIVAALNTLVDSIIAGNFLGKEVMAAMGLFSPVMTIFGLSYVISVGAQILCCKHIGQGESKKLISLFSTCVVFLGSISIIFSALMIIFRYPLAGFLGATGQSRDFLAQYIFGISFGLVGQVMMNMLMCFLSLNNKIKLSYIGMGIMGGLNVGLDILLVCVLQMGAFGMGLATSISHLVTGILLFISFLKKDQTVYFQFGNFCFGRLGEAAILGMPSAMFTIGATIKAYSMNATLLSVGGLDAAAAMAVQGNVCSFVGALPSGIGGTTLMLSGIYYGEEDQESMKQVLKQSLRIGIFVTVIGMAAIIAFSGPIASLFYTKGEAVWLLTRRMLILFPVFLVFNAIFNIFTKIYQSQGQMTFTNVLSVAENLIMAGIAMVAAPFFGCDAVWLSFSASDLLCLILIAISVFIKSGKITFRPEDWLKMDKASCIPPEDRMAFTLHSMEDVINISEKIVDFCDEKGMNPKYSYIAGLCMEEMAGNIVTYGFKPSKKNSIDIRLMYKEGKVILKIRDDCQQFDPKSRMEQYFPEDPLKNIGIRMIGKLASDIDYKNNIGLNVLTITIGDGVCGSAH